MLYLGFNTGMGFLDTLFNKGKSTSGLETSPIFRKVHDETLGTVYYRFPGGTHANYYNRFNAGAGYTNGFLQFNFKGDEPSYISSNVNKSIRDKNYSSYEGYILDNDSGKSNVIYPFINTITSNRKFNAKSTYVLNIINHYRNNSSLSTKKELITNFTKLDNINTLDDILKNGFSSSFKLCVDQNLSGILTLIKNGVIVDKIELGNENYSYMMDGDDKSFKSNMLDTIAWNRSNNNTQKFSLDIMSKLLKMYIKLINNLYNNNQLELPLYGIPITPLYKNSGFRQWNDYWTSLTTSQYVGYTAYIMHPYTSISTGSVKPDKDSSELSSDFKIINQKIQDEHFKKWIKTDLKDQLKTLPKNSEIWFTEWNFGWLIPKIGNTLLGAICYFDEIMGYLEYPQITLCHYHAILNAKDTNFVFTRFANWSNTTYVDPITTENKVSTDVKYSSNYYAHLLLKQVTKLELVSSDIKDNFYTKTFKDNTGTYTYFSNKSGSEINIPISKKSKVNYISGNLYDTFGITTFKTTDDITVKRNFNIDVTNSFTIPKYSIGYIYTENNFL